MKTPEQAVQFHRNLLQSTKKHLHYPEWCEYLFGGGFMDMWDDLPLEQKLLIRKAEEQIDRYTQQFKLGELK